MNKPIGFFIVRYKYVVGIMLNLFHKVVVQRARGKGQIKSDYDQGEWRDLLLSRKWTTASTIEEYLLPSTMKPMMVLMNGEARKVDPVTYYAFRTEMLENVLKKYTNNSDEIIELGSGAGRNLFTLASSGNWRHLQGYEISPVGIEVTKSVASHFNIDCVEVGPIDLLDVSESVARDLRGKTVFTYYCLEQLPTYTEQIFRTLAKIGVKRVINIEPSTELFSLCSMKDVYTISYIWRQDYQRSVLSTARKLEAENVVTLIDYKRLNYAPSLRNDPTLVVWEPI